ncbi:kinesin-like protein KIF20B isoform X2 [Cotesia glomerata]|uniref:kinesin-like protein KIF20B isoform X2 n=1 Tax=Cotesia glomerata TaxID=32391 RepID=UPI001D00C59E|nr:kinesin-like protein KIF20B isoform X2 [Cotesia glomerata]
MSGNNEHESKLDETLDPIRPLSIGTGEMSYIYGRDPSILSYGQRPGPSVETKKNLYSVYEVEETVASLDVSSAQTIKVYLRLKPFNKNVKLTAQEEDAYRITSSSTLLTKLPSQDSHSSIRSSSADLVCRKYIFTETFGPEVSQGQFFERVLQPQMPDFLTGQNATIMTYGTTNSGKSFTLQGTAMEPGLIPRSLEHIFAHINPKEAPHFKPLNHSEVVKLSSSEKCLEIENKNKLLTYGSTDRNQYINAFKKMQQVLEKEVPEFRARESTDAHCAVWVSFAEIYNETIYDLLSNDTSKRRPILKLATDNQGATYIKGLKSVFVNSSCEAYQVLMAGQYNLKVAATALNARSSRSHCIFTVRLLRYFSENDIKSVEMSTFTFCDLAGSERLKKTLNIGDRLKEAQNINTSLMVLGRCLKSIYEVQTVKQQRSEVIGPFRESKLTRLFQTALSGKEPIALIVNVNPSPNLYVETQNVLNFAAIAKKIIIQPKLKKTRRSKTRFSHLVLQTKNTITDWDEPPIECDLESIDDQSSVEDMGYVPAEDYEQVLEENEKLRKEIAQIKSSAFKKDLATREEISKYYMATIKKMEEDHQARLRNIEAEHQTLHEWELDKVETFYQNKLQAVKSYKRKRSEDYDDDEEDDYDDMDTSKGELEIQVRQLNSKVDELKNKLKQALKEKDEILVQKNSATYELSLAKEELKTTRNVVVALENSHVNGKNEAYIEELKQQLSDCEKKKKLHEYTLNEAKKDFIEMRNEIDSKNSQVNKLEIELAHKDEELCDLRQEFHNTEDTLSQKEIILREYEEIIDSQSQKLLKLTDEYENLKQLYKESTKETVLEIQDRNSDANEIIGDLEDKLEAAENEIVLLKEKVADKIVKIDELERKLMESEDNCHDLKERLDKIMEYTMAKPNTSVEEEVATQTSPFKVGKDDVKEVKEVCDGNSQTTSPSTASQSNQTSFIESVDHKALQTSFSIDSDKVDVIECLLEKEKNKFFEMEAKYKEELEHVTELSDELENVKNRLVKMEVAKKSSEFNEKKISEYLAEIETLKATIEELEGQNESLKTSRDYYRSDLGNIEKELSEAKKKVERFTSKLTEKEDVKVELERRLEEYEQRVEGLKEENVKLMELKEACESELKKKDEELIEARNKIDFIKNDLEVKERLASSVEKELEDKKELKRQIEELNREINRLNEESKVLKEFKEESGNAVDKLMEELSAKQRELEKAKKVLEEKIEELEKTLGEKDREINDLQKEIKDSIKLQANDVTEKELKLMIKERDEAKEKLSELDKLNKKLQTKINNMDREIDELRKAVKKYKEELDEFSNLEANYQKTIEGKEHELETFKKNQEEMIKKYETLVKTKDEDVEKHKREVKKMQETFLVKGHNTPRDEFRAPSSDRSQYKLRENKPPKEETSEDESVTERRGRRARKVLEPTSPIPNVTIDEISETESTRSTRKTTAKACPSTGRKTRGRRLYTAVEDGVIAIEMTPEVISSPSPTPSTRSLRTRRNK